MRQALSWTLAGAAVAGIWWSDIEIAADDVQQRWARLLGCATIVVTLSFVIIAALAWHRRQIRRDGHGLRLQPGQVAVDEERLLSRFEMDERAVREAVEAEKDGRLWVIRPATGWQRSA